MDHLELVPHDSEGGYFKEVFVSPHRLTGSADWAAGRPLLSTIYYMLTDDSPRGRLHRNRADIVHFFHQGGPLLYTTISTSGDIDHVVLGPDADAGHRLQVVIPGGFWKATQLLSGSFGLLSEAVCPSFVEEERETIEVDELRRLFPMLPVEVAELAAPTSQLVEVPQRYLDGSLP
jgi:predicted cupin superfamily sugar epimerase